MERLRYFLPCLFFALCTLTSANSDSDVSAFWKAKCDEYYENAEKLETEFPHMVSLGFEGEENDGEKKWVAAGTLLTDRHVLTVAAVTYDRSLGHVKYARLGASNFKTAPSSQIQNFEITAVLRHPNFTVSSYYDNIAILVLDKKVTFNKHVRPVCLEEVKDLDNVEILGTGWGLLTSTSDGPEENLKEIRLVYRPAADCDKMYQSRKLSRGFDEKQLICAAPKFDGKDLCQGDSGGPIQVRHPRHKDAYNEVGITSFGAACGLTKYPGGYTRISYFLPWIKETIA